VFGMNDEGQVVGNYAGSDNVKHGWGGAPAKNEYITIDYPGAEGSQVDGLTNAGHLAGHYTDTNNATHGFLAVPK